MISAILMSAGIAAWLYMAHDNNQTATINSLSSQDGTTSPSEQAQNAYYYRLGNGVVKDVTRAFKLASESVAQNNGCGYYQLGVCYYLGLGVEKDQDRASQLFRQAKDKLREASASDSIASFHLGLWFNEGFATSRDVDQALKYFEQAAVDDIGAAHLALGVMYQLDSSIPQDIGRAINWYEKGVSIGYSPCAVFLAFVYQFGEPGVEVDLTKAFHYHRLAANADDPLGQYQCASMFAAGEGVELDTEKATFWFEKSSDHGFAPAFTGLGLIALHAGNGELAYSNLKKAAGLGDTLGELNLGHCFQKGIGVEADATEAAQWFNAAASKGNAEAQHAFGIKLALGDGVPVNHERGIELISTAANNGYSESAFLLGNYYNEQGAPHYQPALATRWYRLAAEQNHPQAIAALRVISSEPPHRLPDQAEDQVQRRMRAFQRQLQRNFGGAGF